MANAINLSTAGIHLKYAVEETAGTRPTAASAYVDLEGVKSTPNFNVAPAMLQTTTLNEEEYHTYISGLKDIGSSSLEFTFNLTQNLRTIWNTLLEAYETAKLANKAVWFVIIVPGLTESLYFTGQPSKMGLPETGVDAVLETTNYITPTNEPNWYAKPTA